MSCVFRGPYLYDMIMGYIKADIKYEKLKTKDLYRYDYLTETWNLIRLSDNHDNL